MPIPKRSGSISSLDSSSFNSFRSSVILADPCRAFLQFLEEIRDDLNPEISELDAIEMIAQHIITRPVFDALFKGNKFTSENAFSKSMETILPKIYNLKFELYCLCIAKKL